MPKLSAILCQFSLRGFAILLLFRLCSFAQAGVSFPDTATQRGVQPNGSYRFSQLETINKASGNLAYSIPLTSMPLGRGGFSLPVTLNYNSTQYDYSYSYTFGTQSPYPPWLNKTLTGSMWGGWQINPTYWLYTEQKPLATSNDCSVTNGVQRTSLVTPDGSRHTLYFPNFPHGFTGSGDGFFPYSYNGVSACALWPAIALPITLFTIDGSYIRVTVTQQAWTAYLPDGTSITSPSAGGGSEIIKDRNGNMISITNTTTVGGVETVIQDDLKRTITIAPSANLTGTQVTQTGFGGAPLVWTISSAPSPSLNQFTFNYICRDSQQAAGQSVSAMQCTQQDTGGVTTTLQAPGSNGPLTYTFTTGVNNGLLANVTLPTGASAAYTYQCNDYTKCGFREDLLNPVVSKTVTWTDKSDGTATQRTETLVVWKSQL